MSATCSSWLPLQSPRGYVPRFATKCEQLVQAFLHLHACPARVLPASLRARVHELQHRRDGRLDPRETVHLHHLLCQRLTSAVGCPAVSPAPATGSSRRRDGSRQTPSRL